MGIEQNTTDKAPSARPRSDSLWFRICRRAFLGSGLGWATRRHRDRGSLSHAVRCSTRIRIQAQAAAPAVESHRRQRPSVLCQVRGVDSPGDTVASGSRRHT